MLTLRFILRSWWRNKTFTLISILSLAVGIACTNLLTAYIVYETHIEAENPNRERIVCLSQDSPMNSGERVSYVTSDAARQMADKYPEVEASLTMNLYGSQYIVVGEQRFNLSVWLQADSTLTRFFPYEVCGGDLQAALSEPGKVALTENCARRLFGTENPIGKTLVNYDQANQAETFQVAAVVRTHPQSYLHFDALSGGTLYGGTTFLLLDNPNRLDDLARKVKADRIPTLSVTGGQYYFHTLQESYYQDQIYTMESLPYIHRNQKSLVYTGFFAAFLILLIACFNYINLNFSRMYTQAHTIYLQKLMGASAGNIYGQLLTDALLTVLLAFLLSLLICIDLLPSFNRIMDGRLELSFLFSRRVVPLILTSTILLAVMPACYISHRLLRISYTLYKDEFHSKRKSSVVARLSIAQFAISIGLLFATLTAGRQLSLTRQNGEPFRNLVEIGSWESNPDEIRAFADRVRQYPEFRESSLSKGSVIFFSLRQVVRQDEKGQEIYHSIGQLAGETSFLNTLHLPVLQGLPPEEAARLYARPAYINRQFADILVPAGENPVGKPLHLFDKEMEQTDDCVVAGITENLYINSMQSEVPMMVTYLLKKPPYTYLHVRLPDDGEKGKHLEKLHELWDEVNPTTYMNCLDVFGYYMDNNRRTDHFFQILCLYAAISLLLTVAGLAGIARHAAEQRSREIRIRKVNGATTRDILWMLNRQFIVQHLLAFAVIVPPTWIALEKWLQYFTYRTEISATDAVWAGLASLAVILITVSIQSYHTASRKVIYQN